MPRGKDTTGENLDGSAAAGTGYPKKVHKFKIIYFCSENRQITKLYISY